MLVCLFLSSFTLVSLSPLLAVSLVCVSLPVCLLNCSFRLSLLLSGFVSVLLLSSTYPLSRCHSSSFAASIPRLFLVSFAFVFLYAPPV